MARDNKAPRKSEENDGLVKKLIAVNRVTKVVTGGKTMRFAALVIVGDGKGRIGVATGKAKEVPDAVRKATEQAIAQYPGLPVVFSGGVASNAMLRNEMKYLNPIFAQPQYSTDNALGVAIIAHRSQGFDYGTAGSVDNAD